MTKDEEAQTSARRLLPAAATFGAGLLWIGGFVAIHQLGRPELPPMRDAQVECARDCSAAIVDCLAERDASSAADAAYVECQQSERHNALCASYPELARRELCPNWSPATGPPSCAEPAALRTATTRALQRCRRHSDNVRHERACLAEVRDCESRIAAANREPYERMESFRHRQWLAAGAFCLGSLVTGALLLTTTRNRVAAMAFLSMGSLCGALLIIAWLLSQVNFVAH